LLFFAIQVALVVLQMYPNQDQMDKASHLIIQNQILWIKMFIFLPTFATVKFLSMVPGSNKQTIRAYNLAAYVLPIFSYFVAATQSGIDG
jgi:hypothetical protein